MIRGTSPPHGGGVAQRGGWHGAEGCLRIGPQPIGPLPIGPLAVGAGAVGGGDWGGVGVGLGREGATAESPGALRWRRAAFFDPLRLQKA